MLARFALICLMPLLAGCVERLIAVRSEPPGARVFLDGEPVGVTPVDVRYAWYGTRELLVTMEGYRSYRELIVLNAPWWQVFPLDFITDVLIPFTLEDRVERSIALEREAVGPEAADETRRRAREAEAQSAPKDEPKQ